jgi:hypothetical protein
MKTCAVFSPIVASFLAMILLVGESRQQALAQTDQPVAELGGYAVLSKPAGRPRGAIILMPGGNGSLGLTSQGEITQLRGNQLIRTRSRYVAAGFATLALDGSADPAAAVRFMRTIASPVTVVATSRGATRIHRALGGQPDGLVVTAGMLDVFQSNVGSPAALPATLIIHHRQDGCRVTSPLLVDPFIAWSSGRAKVAWLNGGVDEGDPCGAAGHHGFRGLDGQVVARVTSFAASLRRR